MRHIKIFETFESRSDQRKKAEDEFVGNLYKIYPTRNPKEMVVISKCTKILGVQSSWGEFEGYIIHPPGSKGKFWSDSEYLDDIKYGYNNISDKATATDIEEYELYNAMNNYNL